MRRFLLVGALAALGLAGGAAAQDATQPPAEPPGRAAAVDIPYASEVWQLPGDGGLFEAVVTGVRTDADGTTIEGVLFLHDAGGWRVAGAFAGPVGDLGPLAPFDELVPALRDDR